jgi:Flp pilus assembly protein TadB
MFYLFVVVAALSLIALVAGVAWWLISAGKTTRRSGRDVGAEVMGSGPSDSEGAGATLIDKSAFVGTGVTVESVAETSSADIKQALRAGQWRSALPPLLAICGLCGFLLFGALALSLRIEEKPFAFALVAIAVFAVGRIAYDFMRR